MAEPSFQVSVSLWKLLLRSSVWSRRLQTLPATDRTAVANRFVGVPPCGVGVGGGDGEVAEVPPPPRPLGPRTGSGGGRQPFPLGARSRRYLPPPPTHLSVPLRPPPRWGQARATRLDGVAEPHSTGQWSARTPAATQGGWERGGARISTHSGGDRILNTRRDFRQFFQVLWSCVFLNLPATTNFIKITSWPRPFR